MNRIVTTVACLATMLLAAGCGSDAVTDATTLRGIAFERASIEMEEGESFSLIVVGDFGDTKRDVTAEAELSLVGDAAVLEGRSLIGRVPGEATVIATYEGYEAKATIAVAERTYESLVLRADGPFEVGTEVQLRTFGVDAAGEEIELRTGVVYSSSREDMVTVDETGLASVIAGGEVTLTAAARGLEATLEDRAFCEYPHFTPKIALGRVMPNLSWPAKWPDGKDFEMRMEDVYCHADWKDVETFTLVLSAGWCNPCTQYARMLEQEVGTLSALGMETMIIEVQTYDPELADLTFAWNHLRSITQNVPSIVAGDLDTRPQSGFLQDSEILKAFPTVLVVRTDDMRIISDQFRSRGWLPLADIARNPDADWTYSSPAFVNRCLPSQQEDSEPNDTPDQAALLAPGTVEGGICKEGAADMYRVELEGAWTVELAFDNAQADLDVVVFDPETNAPMIDEQGFLIGSATSNGLETFSHSGPAILSVSGFRNSSAPYTLTLRAE